MILLLSERANVGGQTLYLPVVEQPRKARHEWFEPRDDVALWLEDRIPEIGIVCFQLPTVRQLNGPAVKAVELGGMHAGRSCVAPGAALRYEEFGAEVSEVVAFGLSAQPPSVVVLTHDRDPAAH